jgi:holo-[acyl-carrier protein] synthase
MIFGIGTDIIQIPRIHALYTKSGDKLAHKILSPSEIIEYSAITIAQKPAFLAKRFAAKESIAKAFGVGIGKDIAFCDIEILHDNLGKPLAKVHRDIALDKNIFLSISDDFPIVVAFAIVFNTCTNIKAESVI